MKIVLPSQDPLEEVEISSLIQAESFPETFVSKLNMQSTIRKGLYIMINRKYLNSIFFNNGQPKQFLS